MQTAIDQCAETLRATGWPAVLANRRVMRLAGEPLDTFRRYMASYAREQSYCMYSRELSENLARNWTGRGGG